MELRQLRYFVAIAEVENFRRASERLKIAQPALSHQIGALEKEIGAQLFDRLPRGVRLSEAGRSFLADAKTILAKLDDARDKARRIGTGRTAPLRIAFSEMSNTDALVAESISRFREQVPQVEVALSPMPSRLQEKALRDRQVDACFLYLTQESDADFGYIRLRDDSVFAAIPLAHRLAGKRRIGIGDFVDEPMIWMKPSVTPRLHDSLKTAFARAGVVPRIVQESSSASQMLKLVAMGQGLGLTSSADWASPPAGAVLKPIHDLALHYPFDFAWRKGDTSASLAAFIAIVRDIASRQRRSKQRARPGRQKPPATRRAAKRPQRGGRNSSV